MPARLDTEIQVLVVNLSGKTVAVDLAPGDTPDDLRQKLQCRALIPEAENLQLLLNGRLLDSLDSVERGSILRVAGRLRGGGARGRTKLQAAFRKVDTNGDGKICFDDFLLLLRKGRPDFTEEQAEALFHVVDKDLSGEIDFHEFIDYLYDQKSMEDFILPVMDDRTEEQAKAYVLAKTLRVRSAASKAVKARGGVWSQMSWKERMDEVMKVAQDMPESMPASPTPQPPAEEAPPRREEQPVEEPPQEAEPPASGGLGELFAAGVGMGGGGASDLFAMTGSMLQAAAAEEADAAEVATAAAAAVAEAPGSGLPRSNSKARGSVSSISSGMAGMSQSSMVDYSLTQEDLAWAGDTLDVLTEMRSFKEHLRTAGGPYDAINIERYVAKGTAGWVFQVSRKSTGERMAMKLIRMTQVRTGIKEWYVSRLMREEGLADLVFTDETCYVLERATAPDIIQEELRDAGPVPYYVCFVQEFVDGGTLEGLAMDGKLTPSMLLQAMEGVATTLAKMHARNVQHRDIKPENVLVKMIDGTLAATKLCDFGRAELLKSPKGRQDDVRRFGVTLFSLATGEGWTANRLIHEEHDALVARLTEAVRDSGSAALQGLPGVLAQILSGSLEMSEVIPMLQRLRASL